MDFTPLIPIVAIIAFAAVRIARLRATRPETPAADVTARLEALERTVQGLQQELGDTQERLDFTERLLSKARDERRLGSSTYPLSLGAAHGRRVPDLRRRAAWSSPCTGPGPQH